MVEPSFDRVKFKGKTIGADMLVHRSGQSDYYQDCCSINIYVNNNIIGANNSLLVGSKVKMVDPGPGITFKGLKINRGIPRRREPSWLRFFEIFLVVAMLLLLIYQAVLLNL